MKKALAAFLVLVPSLAAAHPGHGLPAPHVHGGEYGVYLVLALGAASGVSLAAEWVAARVKKGK